MIFAVIALCWTIVLGVVLTQLSLNRTSTWDEKLRAIATQLLVTIPADSNFNGRGRPGLKLKEISGAEHEQLVFQIWIDRNRMVANTPGSPELPLKPDFSDGAASTRVENHEWRVYSASDSTGRVTVQVGESTEHRRCGHAP